MDPAGNFTFSGMLSTSVMVQLPEQGASEALMVQLPVQLPEQEVSEALMEQLPEQGASEALMVQLPVQLPEQEASEALMVQLPEQGASEALIACTSLLRLMQNCKMTKTTVRIPRKTTKAIMRLVTGEGRLGGGDVEVTRKSDLEFLSIIGI